MPKKIKIYKGNLHSEKSIKLKSFLVIISSIIIITVIIYFHSSIAAKFFNKNDTSLEKSINELGSNKVKKVKYKDGIYTGNSYMYVKPNIKVSVTIKDGKIIDIKGEQTEGTPGYYDSVINVIPKEIIKAQSTEVDVVSGASASSEGIIVSTQEALEKAKN